MAGVSESAPAIEHKVRPTKPDEEAYKTNLANAEKEHAAAQEKLNQIKTKIGSARPNNQDSPAGKRQRELRTELSAIRQKQQGFKASRSGTQEKINALDATLKARIAEQNNSRSRMSFKSVEDIDREIARLEKQVDSGTLRLVDERNALSEVSNLRKQRKSFAGLDDTQKVISDLKNQIADLRKTFDNPESKELSDKYAAIQKELDAIKSEQDSAFKNLNALRDERTKLHAEQQQKYTAIREIKDEHFKARKAYKEYEDEAWRIRRERQKAQRDAIEREKKKKVADRKLEEASVLAYTDEILTAQALIRHFNPNYDFAALGLDDDKKGDTSTFRAQVGRTVDDSNIKGVKVVKKEDREEEYFSGTGGKKGKKGKKGSSNTTPTPGTPSEGAKFNLSFGIIEDFAKLKIDPPMSQSDVPAIVEKLAADITNWKKNQVSKTEENIKKAQDDIVRLEEEADSSAPKTNGNAKKANGVNGIGQEADKEAATEASTQA